jgi:acyl-CoA reductase-like NAD-dependent aldehyde dehydrogenase
MATTTMAPIFSYVFNKHLTTFQPNDLQAPIGPEPESVAAAEAAESEDDGSSILQCTDPAKGELFTELRCVSPEQVDEAINNASLAFAMWKGTTASERLKAVHRLTDLIRDQADRIAAQISREQGKPVQEALTQEILPALDHLNFLAIHAEETYSGRPIQPRHVFFAHKQVHYLYEPFGLVAIATPYCMPFFLPLVQIASALAMGNAVLFKPSELTPLTGLLIGELCRDAGFPEGIVQVLPMQRDDAMFLVSHPGIDKIFLTGSPESGRQVMAIAGCMPKPVVLSLGGKSPAVVADDADLERTAQGVVWGALANAGQNCTAVEQVFVTEGIASRFTELILKKVDALTMGDPATGEVDIGPLISAWRRRHVHSQVEEAVQAGARLLRGGKIPNEPGFFYPPTVVLNPPLECRLMTEETLGPVITIVVCDSVERAIFQANQSDFALSASGWTGSRETAERMMSGLHAGIVTINDVLYAGGEPAATKSGYRMSGLGNLHGIAGLQEMCRRRFATSDLKRLDGPLFSFPYNREYGTLRAAAVALLHGRSLVKRIGGLLRLFTMKRFRRRVPGRFLLLRSRRRRG